MARPREFDEAIVLAAAMNHFWAHGYEATSVRDLQGATGLTGSSLYNAFGDKRALYRRARDQYVERSIADIVERSLADRERKGCMLVNAALDVAPHDPEFKAAVGAVLDRIEAFFAERIVAGQADGTIERARNAEDLARHLLGVLMGVRVLARVRPERATLDGVVAPALDALRP